MRHLMKFEKYFLKTQTMLNVLNKKSGWIVLNMDMSNPMVPDFEIKFNNYWSPEKIDSVHYAVEVIDEAGLEELRHFLNNALGKLNYTVVEEQLEYE